MPIVQEQESNDLVYGEDMSLTKMVLIMLVLRLDVNHFVAFLTLSKDGLVALNAIGIHSFMIKA